MFLQDRACGIDLLEPDIIAPEVGDVLEHMRRGRVLKQASVHDAMAQHQAAVAGEVDIDDLDIRIGPADVVLAGQLAADPAIAALVMDRRRPSRLPSRAGSSCRWNIRICRISRGLRNWLTKLSSR
jgi:hypothetical protein